MLSRVKYRRIILKFSGAALAGKNGFGFDYSMFSYLAGEIKPLLQRGVQVGIVVGGGNLFRGAELTELDRITADHMGMLATLSNALALRDFFLKDAIAVQVMSALPIAGIVEVYDRISAIRALDDGKLLIFAGGTGNPLVTTDTALSLRGIELNANLLLKATNVDGVYSENPDIDAKAQFFSYLTYEEVLLKKLQVMDLIAFSLLKDHDMVLRVYNIRKKSALLRIILGEDEGTLVTNSKD